MRYARAEGIKDPTHCASASVTRPVLSPARRQIRCHILHPTGDGKKTNEAKRLGQGRQAVRGAGGVGDLGVPSSAASDREARTAVPDSEELSHRVFCRFRRLGIFPVRCRLPSQASHKGPTKPTPTPRVDFKFTSSPRSVAFGFPKFRPSKSTFDFVRATVLHIL